MSSQTTIETPESQTPNPDLFIKFYYAEIKDLSKSFLTLVSGILAFSITFSTSIIGVSTASILQLILLICAWLSFVIAIIAAGWGLYSDFVSANIANKAIHAGTNLEFKQLLIRPYRLLTVAGAAFVIGLILLAIAGVTNITAQGCCF